MNSNIAADSNVYLSREDDPRRDPDFLAQIQDYDRLKKIADRKKIDYKIPKFSKTQETIINQGMRCTYAKNDPCWGYSKKTDRYICACINSDCPKIMACNPNYSPEDEKNWQPSDADKQAYGDPKKQRLYYLVDMISDEEMRRYESTPKNEGLEYTISNSYVSPAKQEKPQQENHYIIDPVTKKKRVVVGYRWVITDNASYESDGMIPIWGFVDGINSKTGTAVKRKAKRIEKKDILPFKANNVKSAETIPSPDYTKKEELENAVTAVISDAIKLTDLDANYFSNRKESLVLLDNPAELAFVSGVFLVNEIEHGIKTDLSVRLAVIDDYPKYRDCKQIMVSNTVLKKGCSQTNVAAWESLAEQSEITQLNIAERDYYRFSYGKQECRWTCRNMYGVTHICVNPTDIIEMIHLPDGSYPVSLIEDSKTYRIVTEDGKIQGRLGNSFVGLINALKESGEVAFSPNRIIGLSIQVKNGIVEFLGMGHLKFTEY